MTICIAGIYEGNKIIAITDKMLTLSGSPATKYEINENNKAIKLTENSVAMFSGEVIQANQILERAMKIITSTDTVEEVAEKVRLSYLEQWREEIQNNVFNRFSLDHTIFVNNHKNLEPDLVNRINKVLIEANLGVEVIVAGINNTKAKLFLIQNPGTVTTYDSLNYVTIGSGAQHATLSLIESEYNSQLNKGEALFYLYQAKKRAEFDPGVGTLCDIIFLDGTFEKATKEVIEKIDSEFKKSQEEIKKIQLKYSEIILEPKKNATTTTKSKK